MSMTDEGCSCSEKDMRRIYLYLDREQKKEALALLRHDVSLLHAELQNEYPRVVRDAIEETIRRYTQDINDLEHALINGHDNQ